MFCNYSKCTTILTNCLIKNSDSLRGDPGEKTLTLLLPDCPRAWLFVCLFLTLLGLFLSLGVPKAQLHWFPPGMFLRWVPTATPLIFIIVSPTTLLCTLFMEEECVPDPNGAPEAGRSWTGVGEPSVKRTVQGDVGKSRESCRSRSISCGIGASWMESAVRMNTVPLPTGNC